MESVIVSVALDAFPLFNYSNILALQRPLRGLSIRNDSDVDVVDVVVRVDSATDLLTDRDLRVPRVPAGEQVEVDCSEVSVDTKRLLQLTERMTDTLAVDVLVNNEVVASASSTIEFFAFDQWLGTPESLAAFVTPNYPSLAPVIIRASEHLEKWSGSPSFTGYQIEDPERARLQAAALFRALQEQAIVYVGAPASFSAGQRIRMADAVLSQHMATCLDFSTLYASCLEAVGLNPLIIIVEGHAYCGVWLEDRSFQEIVEEDVTSITGRFAAGVEQLTVVQCTMLAKGNKASFEEAERSARENTQSVPFVCAVDVHRARASMIVPLPIRVMGDDGWNVETTANELGKAVAPTRKDVSRAIIEAESGPRTKKQLWERSLLDLSMRNNLLNMRMGTRVMPIFTPSIDEVEDTLALDNDIIIAPKPDEFPSLAENDAFSIIDTGEAQKELLRAEFRYGRLRTAFTEAALRRNLTNLYRSAKSSLEETGANTLFLTLGALKWVDEKRGNKTHLAPLMLFPIDIIRKSAKTGYVMHLRDEEAQINISLIEMLRVDYGIQINGLDPLPLDEAGVDTRLVLNTVRAKVMDEKGWEVLEIATVGLFSFSQFVMWNDIRSSEAALRKNKIVDSLIEGHLTWTPEVFDSTEQVDPTDLLLPTELDASQMFAVKKAVDGASFVLHGPPGTGKSQTITALIANALARGRRVLFVAEKMAALEVVERRLAELGLEPFCLEVHSTKATKNHVFEQIQAASEVGRVARSDAYEYKAEEVAQLRKKLDTYAEGLAKPNEAGLSLREQICRYRDLASHFEPIPVRRSLVQSISSEGDFAAMMNAAERLVAVGKVYAPIKDYPLAFVTGSSYTQQLRENLPVLIQDYREALRDAEGIVAEACELIDMPVPASFADLALVANDAETFCRWQNVPSSWLAAGNANAVANGLLEVYAKAMQLDDLKASLANRRQESYFGLDPAQLRSDWIEANAKGIFQRGKAVSRVLATLSLASKEPVSKDDVANYLAELEQYRSLEADVARQTDRLATYLAPFTSMTGVCDWQQVYQVAQETIALAMGARTLSDARLSVYLGRQDVIDWAQSYLDFFTRLASARQGLVRAVGKFVDLGQDGPWIARELELLEQLDKYTESLHNWMSFNRSREKARAMGLEDLLGYLEEHAVDDTTFPSFKCGVYRRMCMESLDTTTGMNSFNGTRFNETVNQYARADQELRDLARREIYYRVASRAPDLTLESARTPEAARLQRALRSRGRNVSVRSIFSECENVVFSLCPCLLMSPLSVAQYLEPGRQQFDIVVFDEASQLQTCKAVGAMARAKEAVIVGDPRQMPPTSFFQGKVDDEEFEQISDLESVLEDCLALNMPQAYLKWHYRSQHESLIAFSNRRFYEGRMYTFPSADDLKSRVSLVHVDGFFDRKAGRVNQAEAEAIVAEIRRRANDRELCHQSVGVVTFNIPQQNLIDDLFQKACADDSALDAWATKSDEPIFIKNLENVQGDERDVILFSVTYAPDAEGKMSMNFGPINREGGWRRLNVAVTRARVGMMVFSSMDSTDIDLNRTSSMGPAALRSFLEYAQRGSFTTVNTSEVSLQVDDDQIAQEIAAHLQTLGYRVKENVGRSVYRVDLAVVDPEDSSRYVAGILLDGASYGMAGTTRDREVAQPHLLERLGWNVYRVWALDWWENSEGVLDKIGAYLEGLGAFPRVAEPEPTAEKPRLPQEQTDVVVDMRDEMLSEAAEVANAARVNAVASDIATEEAGFTRAERETSLEDRDNELELTATDRLAPAPEELTLDVLANDGVVHQEQKVASAELIPAETSAEIEPITTGPVKGKQEYRPANIQVRCSEGSFADLDARDVAQTMDEILIQEAPIEKGLLFRRTYQAYGVTHSGKQVLGLCDRALKFTRSKRVSQAGRTIVWRREQDPMTYRVYRVSTDAASRRNVNELPLEEIAAAAQSALLEEGPLSPEETAKAVGKLLGYVRLGPNMRDFIPKGVTLAARRGWIRREGKLYIAVPPEE